MADIHRFQPFRALLLADKLDLLARGGLPTPAIWHVYPTNACPNDCTFCIMREEREANRMRLSDEQLLRAVREAQKSGAGCINLEGGGEPLGHPALTRALRLARELGLRTSLVTNAIPAGYQPELAAQIGALVDYLRISLNAGDRATYEAIHRRDHWEAALAGTKILREHTRGDFGLGFVLVPENADSIMDFVAIAREIGADFVHIRPAWWPERDAEVRRAAQIVAEALRGLEIPGLAIYCRTDKMAGKWDNPHYAKCRATPTLVCLKANGRFCVCQDRTDLEFGHIDQGFAASWLSAEHLEAMERIRIEACPRCVEGMKNELIEKAFLEDGLRRELI